MEFSHQNTSVSFIVHLCSDDGNPRSAVFRQSLSAQFVYFDGRSLIVPYTRLTFANKAIGNVPYLPLSNAGHVRRLKRLGIKALESGYTICRARPDSPDEQPLSCYSNIRTTLDGESQTF